MEVVYISLTGVISLLTLLLGFRVFLANRGSVINRSFAIFAFLCTLWLVLDFLTYQTSLANLQTLFYKVIFSVIILMVLALASFVNYFPKTFLKIGKLTKWAILIITLVTVVISLFTKGIVDYAFMQDYGSNFQQGNLFILFIIYVSVLSIYILIALIAKLIKSRDYERKQLKYLLYGLGIFIFLNLAFNMFIPMFTNSFIYGRIGTYSSIFFIGFLAYAILKTHLFDLRIILTETAIIIINVISIVQIFIAPTALEVLLRMLFAVIIFYGSLILLKSVRKEISQRQKIEELARELKDANQHLKELDEEKDNFLSMASHELNSPLAAIKGYLSMMLDEGIGGKLSSKQHEYLDMVYTSAKRLAHLVKDLLNVSRIEQGRIHLVLAETSINDIINQAAMELSPNIKEAKHKLVLNLEEKLPTSWWDLDRINEVVTNLLSNAVKYTDPGGRIEITSQTAGDKILVSIADNGVGIPKVSIGKIFGKFEQGNMTRDQRKGTGLGLYIVKNLIELHGGKIWVDSVEGKGTTFFFTLPIHKTKPLDIHDGEGGVLRLK